MPCGRAGGRSVGKSRVLWAAALSPHVVHRDGVLRPHEHGRRPQLSTERRTGMGNLVRPQTVYGDVRPHRARENRAEIHGSSIGVRGCGRAPRPGITRMSQPTATLWMTVDNSAHTLCTNHLRRCPDAARRIRWPDIHRFAHPGGELCGWSRAVRGAQSGLCAVAGRRVTKTSYERVQNRSGDRRRAAVVSREGSRQECAAPLMPEGRGRARTWTPVVRTGRVKAPECRPVRSITASRTVTCFVTECVAPCAAAATLIMRSWTTVRSGAPSRRSGRDRASGRRRGRGRARVSARCTVRAMRQVSPGAAA